MSDFDKNFLKNMSPLLVTATVMFAMLFALPANALGDNEKDALKILAGSALIYSATKDADINLSVGTVINGYGHHRYNNRGHSRLYSNHRGYRSDSRRRRENSCRWTTLSTRIYDRYGRLQEVNRTKVCR
mgnify:FL=1